MAEIFEKGITRRTVLVASTAVLGMGFLDACASVVSQQGGTTTTGKKGGNFVIGQINDIDLKALVIEGRTNDVSWLACVFDRLAQYERPSLNIKPMLAQSWKYSSDGLSLTLNLRTDVKFHTGRPFGPDDVIWNLQHLQDPAASSQFRNTANKITDMSKDGASSVTLKFSQPISNIFDLFEFMSILDKETFSDLASGKQVIGTGPFKFTSWTPNDNTVLSRNPSYWMPGLPYFDTVTIRVIPQSTSLLAALQTGQVHMVIDPSTKDLAPFQTSKFKIDNDHAGDVNYYLAFNVKVKPFDNPVVRQAIAYSIDSKRINEQVLLSLGTPTSLPWPKSSPAYDSTLAGHYSYDPTKAKSMLASAGITSLQCAFTLDNALPATVDMGQIIQSNLKDVGIDAAITQVPPAQISTYLTGSSFPGIFVLQTPFGNLQPATLVQAAFPYQAAKNAENYISSDYQSAANALWTARTAGDVKTAAAAVNKALIDDVPIYSFLLGTLLFVHPSNVAGLHYGMNKHPYLESAYFS